MNMFSPPFFQQRSRGNKLVVLFALLVLMGGMPSSTQAQEPDKREMRSYIPPDQLVSFDPSTPFETFIDFVNPIFKRVTGKEIVDPEGRDQSIDVNISRMHFFDAFELVLEANELSYRETERVFMIKKAATPEGAPGAQTASAGTAAAPQQQVASLDSREIKINALLFEVNRTKARELGLNWSTFLGQGGGSGGQSSGGQSGGQGGGSGPRFFLRTDDLADAVDDIIIAPNQVEISTLAQFFRFLESEGVGETVANPAVNVQSGEQGRIQIGSDIPVQTRDFSGNTVTEFFSTGIIVEVTPTLVTEPVADTLGAPVLDFIHLNVRVEDSGSRPTGRGAPAIDRSVANTQVLLLDGEQTMIGGLYSTEETVNRKGIPLLKDLPPWFFGLRYVFGYEQVNKVQKELMIVLQAEVMEPLERRAEQPLEDDLLEKRRRKIKQVLQQFSEETAEETETPPEAYE